jgi:hypothetical protein
MILKPIKTYGKGYEYKLYKHFVEQVKNVYLPTSTDSYNVSVNVNNVFYGVYRISNTEPYVTKLSYSEGIVEINNNNVKTITAKGQICYIENETDKIFIKLKSVKQGSSIDLNNATFEISFNEFKGELLENTYQKLSNYESNKYYYMGSYGYIPNDDINNEHAQFIKGNIVNQETRTIRWDIDNIPIEEDDLVVLEGKIYQVGTVTTVFKNRLTYYKSYVATLISLQ